MSTQTRLITADEFLVWPEAPGLRQELIRGVVVSTPLRGWRHGQVAMEVGCLLGNHIEAAGLGETYAAGTGFIVERDPDTVLGPDLGFVRTERLATIGDPRSYIPFAPDLAVEVISPSDRDDEVEEKVQMWLKAGSLLVWTVDTERRTVTVYRPGAEPVTLTADQEIDGGDVTPGFRCRVADFFA